MELKDKFSNISHKPTLDNVNPQWNWKILYRFAYNESTDQLLILNGIERSWTAIQYCLYFVSLLILNGIESS